MRNRHAAASYHHFDLLLYLISVGGDINIRDEEGETPLFTVESEQAARWLVEHGADPLIQNEEGQTVCPCLLFLSSWPYRVDLIIRRLQNTSRMIIPRSPSTFDRYPRPTQDRGMLRKRTHAQSGSQIDKQTISWMKLSG